MTTQPGTIAVFGATGKQGGPVVDALLSRGAHVRALVRNPGSDRAEALAARGVPLQLIAVRDIGQIAATLLLEDAKAPGGAIEIAGDERTGSEMAAAFGEHAGLPARYEALPLAVLGDSEDAQAMFRWFAETPAYQADFGTVKAIHPGVLDLSTWLRASGWTPPEPGQK